MNAVDGTVASWGPVLVWRTENGQIYIGPKITDNFLKKIFFLSHRSSEVMASRWVHLFSFKVLFPRSGFSVGEES